MPSVSFDATAFRSRFPEFAAVSTTLLGLFFDEACIYLDNTDTSLVTDLTQRAILLNLLVAHITTINGAVDGSGGGPVGRVASVSQGGVSASFEAMPAAGGTQAWFQQTQYGSSYWAMTARYRSFRYVVT